MYYFATPKQQSENLTIFERAKSIKAIHASLTRKAEVWPDSFPSGLVITVCKKDKRGQLQHYADYYFEPEKMRRLSIIESMFRDF